jgi:hypothetical protein
MKSNFTVPVGTHWENMKYFKIFGGQTESYKFPVAVTAMNIQGVELLMILVILQHYQKLCCD